VVRGVIPQKTELFITTSVGTSNPMQEIVCYVKQDWKYILRSIMQQYNSDLYIGITSTRFILNNHD
jgi:hypothetical protein